MRPSHTFPVAATTSCTTEQLVQYLINNYGLKNGIEFAKLFIDIEAEAEQHMSLLQRGTCPNCNCNCNPLHFIIAARFSIKLTLFLRFSSVDHPTNLLHKELLFYRRRRHRRSRCWRRCQRCCLALPALRLFYCIFWLCDMILEFHYMPTEVIRLCGLQTSACP